MTDQRIYAASLSMKIVDAQPMDFFSCITQTAVAVGQNPPAPEAMLIIRQTIADTLPWVTIMDITIALQMNLARQLPEFVKPYGELSAAYLMEILTQYQPIRGRICLKYREMQAKENQRELAPREITDEDWMNIVRKDAEWKRQGMYHWKYMAGRMCQWLWDNGHINDDSFTRDEWRAFNAEARARVMQSHFPPLTIGMVDRMQPHQRDKFDMQCLDEKKMLVYGRYLDALNLTI
jgi:hypothetical protein